MSVLGVHLKFEEEKHTHTHAGFRIPSWWSIRCLKVSCGCLHFFILDISSAPAEQSSLPSRQQRDLQMTTSSLKRMTFGEHLTLGSVSFWRIQ